MKVIDLCSALSEEALKPINDADTTETSERTRLAMEKVIQGKIKQTQPSQIVKSAKEESGQPEFIKFNFIIMIIIL